MNIRTLKRVLVLFTTAAALTLAGSSVALAGPGCGDHDKKEAKKEHKEDAPSLAVTTVDELASALEKGEATPIDANRDKFRAEHGQIPGATLLTSSSEFDESELPEDKASALVFYCANQRCSASHKAAKRAKGFGFENVSVLTAGLMGWVEAGQEVQPVATN